MVRHLGIDLDIGHTAPFEAPFLHASPDIHRELNCEIVSAHTLDCGVGVHTLGTAELVADPGFRTVGRGLARTS